MTHVTEPNQREKHHGTPTFDTNYCTLKGCEEGGPHWKNN